MCLKATMHTWAMEHEHLYALRLQIAQAILHRLENVRLAHVVHVHGILGPPGARVDNSTLSRETPK